MELITVRHAESIGNNLGVKQGHSNYGLSEQGVKQAKQLGKRFKNMKIDYIYTSDLARAYETASYIKSYHKNVPVISTGTLRERNYGVFTGKKGDAIKDKFGGENEAYQALFTHSSVESTVSVFTRTSNFFSFLKENYLGKRVVIISHNGFLKLFHQFLTLGNTYDESAFMQFSNTGVSVYTVSNQGDINIAMCNDTSHINKDY